MAVRLAVTLGATTLLTIGAVTVGAATKGSDKNEITTDTAAESSDPGTSGTRPTREPQDSVCLLYTSPSPRD